MTITARWLPPGADDSVRGRSLGVAVLERDNEAVCLSEPSPCTLEAERQRLSQADIHLSPRPLLPDGGNVARVPGG